MKTTLQRKILNAAGLALKRMPGQQVDVLDVSRPPDIEYAVHLGKVVSKLSPLVGNMLEYRIALHLNTLKNWGAKGTWVRQDPGFPDTTFRGQLQPEPGIEIKTWFPLATEITARFKDSQNHFEDDNIDVALVAWLPENLIWGPPRIIDVFIASAISIAKARDLHYHAPPTYLVMEPEDTSARTSNLQQTNTNGYLIQLPPDKRKAAKILLEAQSEVRGWGADGAVYNPGADYQTRLRGLMGKFNYRLDTNYAKMDRIQHGELESFKSRVLENTIRGRTIRTWAQGINRGDPVLLRELI